MKSNAKAVLLYYSIISKIYFLWINVPLKLSDPSEYDACHWTEAFMVTATSATCLTCSSQQKTKRSNCPRDVSDTSVSLHQSILTHSQPIHYNHVNLLPLQRNLMNHFIYAWVFSIDFFVHYAFIALCFESTQPLKCSACTSPTC